MKRGIVLSCIIVGLLIYSTCVLREEEPEKNAGVTIYKPNKFYNGYTLYNSVRREEATLIDMQGYIIHRWSYPLGLDWLNVKLLPNGHIVVLKNWAPDSRGVLLELDWDSNLVWKMELTSHHDFDKLDNGNIIVVCQEYVVNKELYPGALNSDRLLEITPDKKIVWEWHADQHALELKNFVDIEIPFPDPKRENVDAPPANDWAHMNSIEVLKDNQIAKKDSRFKKGNILFSMRRTNIIGVIEKETGNVVWAWGPGVLVGQHNPTMLDNGNILIFDNGNNGAGIDRGYSRVLEIEPLTGKIVWEYKATPPESFYTGPMGSSQRLPNGNTFIADSMNGRLFEVTPDGEIVWEYMNPDLRPNGKRMSLYRTLRFSRQFVEKILADHSKQNKNN